MPEILDLALQLLRAYGRPLAVTLLVGVLPMAAINHVLIGRIADLNYAEIDVYVFWQIVRYLWDMSLLVFIEAPLATAFVTAYLGQAAFQERPRIRTVLLDVLRLSPRLLLTQGMLRGVFAAWLLMAFVDPEESFTGLEGLLILVAGWAALLRSIRPYMNEIVLLERNPLRGRQPGVMTVGRRSSLLHNGSVVGDLFARWLGTALVAVLMGYMVFGALWCIPGHLLEDWLFSYELTAGGFPLALWLVAGYFAVVRYLAYLDLRIRQEGWEVELKLRAEAARLASKLT
jgi:hypothetical protein